MATKRSEEGRKERGGAEKERERGRKVWSREGAGEKKGGREIRKSGVSLSTKIESE